MAPGNIDVEFGALRTAGGSMPASESTTHNGGGGGESTLKTCANDTEPSSTHPPQSATMMTESRAAAELPILCALG